MGKRSLVPDMTLTSGCYVRRNEILSNLYLMRHQTTTLPLKCCCFCSLVLLLLRLRLLPSHIEHPTLDGENLGCRVQSGYELA